MQSAKVGHPSPGVTWPTGCPTQVSFRLCPDLKFYSKAPAPVILWGEETPGLPLRRASGFWLFLRLGPEAWRTAQRFLWVFSSPATHTAARAGQTPGLCVIPTLATRGASAPCLPARPWVQSPAFTPRFLNANPESKDVQCEAVDTTSSY